MERGRERERERDSGPGQFCQYTTVLSPAQPRQQDLLIGLSLTSWNCRPLLEEKYYSASPGHKPPGDIDVWSEERGRPQCRCLKCKTRLSSFPPLIPSTTLTTSHHVSLHRADLNQLPALAREIINSPLWSGGSRPCLYCLLTDQPAGVRWTCSRVTTGLT